MPDSLGCFRCPAGLLYKTFDVRQTGGQQLSGGLSQASMGGTSHGTSSMSTLGSSRSRMMASCQPNSGQSHGQTRLVWRANSGEIAAGYVRPAPPRPPPAADHPLTCPAPPRRLAATHFWGCPAGPLGPTVAQELRSPAQPHSRPPRRDTQPATVRAHPRHCIPFTRGYRARWRSVTRTLPCCAGWWPTGCLHAARSRAGRGASWWPR